MLLFQDQNNLNVTTRQNIMRPDVYFPDQLTSETGVAHR